MVFCMKRNYVSIIFIVFSNNSITYINFILIIQYQNINVVVIINSLTNYINDKNIYLHNIEINYKLKVTSKI